MNDRRSRRRAPIHRVGGMAEEHRRRSGVDKRKPNENQRARCTSRGSPVLQDVGAGMFASAVGLVKWNKVGLSRWAWSVYRLSPATRRRIGRTSDSRLGRLRDCLTRIVAKR